MKNNIKKILLLFVFAILLVPNLVVASTYNYEDNVYYIVNENKSDKLTIYFFHSKTCSHCKLEGLFLDDLEEEYDDEIEIRRYEVTTSKENSNFLVETKRRFNETSSGVPYTIIGNKTYLGYSEATGKNIKAFVEDYFDDEDKVVEEKKELVNLPLLGEVDAKKVSLPLVGIVLGTVDGFNPCAMWVLLFLINMLFTMKNRKKMWILGLTFLFTSAFVYFLTMLGLSFVIGMTAVIWVRIVIALVAITGGLINLKGYIDTPKDGCAVVDEKKRKKYFTKMKKFTLEKNIFISLVGVIALAASVNLVELACSAGFPTIFISMLKLNGITGITSVLYILLYIIFFLIDDVVIFILAMKTLSISGVTTKYNKLSKLVGGIIMIIIGLLLILKPEWIMLNF